LSANCFSSSCSSVLLKFQIKLTLEKMLSTCRTNADRRWSAFGYACVTGAAIYEGHTIPPQAMQHSPPSATP
jgi:hypothetical protein